MAWLARGFLSLWGLAAGALGISFLKAPDEEEHPTLGLVQCGPIATLPVGEARLVRHGAEPLFVVRVTESEIVAMSAICSHLRCILKWDPASHTILCPCHAGVFDRAGNPISGPPVRPLRQYSAEVRAGAIVVRT